MRSVLVFTLVLVTTGPVGYLIITQARSSKRDPIGHSAKLEAEFRADAGNGKAQATTREGQVPDPRQALVRLTRKPGVGLEAEPPTSQPKGGLQAPTPGRKTVPIARQGVRPSRLDQLDLGLVRHTPELLRKLEKKYQNVGVLPFAVQLGDAALTYRAGTLNTSMARRLENALLVASRSTGPLQIIHNAAATAQKQDPKVDHTTAEGRRKLFGYKYPLLWKADPVTPDVFLTGDILVGIQFVKDSTGKEQRFKNWRYTTIVLRAFDKDSGDKLTLLDRFEVRTDRTLLVESGRGFRLAKGAFKLGLAPESIALGPPVDLTPPNSEKYPGGIRPQPVVLEESKVDVQIFYDGTLQEPRPANGKSIRATKFRLKPPAQGTKIKIVVTNREEEKIGAVVTVNGINTLYKEDDNDAQFADKTAMSRWILAPGKSVTIRGFYLAGDREFQPFEVLGLEAFNKDFAVFSSTDVTLRGTIMVHILKTGQPGQDSIVQSGFKPGQAPDSLVGTGPRPLVHKGLGDLLHRGRKGQGKNLIGGATNTKPTKLTDNTLPHPVHFETRIYRYFDVSPAAQVRE